MNHFVLLVELEFLANLRYYYEQGLVFKKLFICHLVF